jgi:hypothetical protein
MHQQIVNFTVVNTRQQIATAVSKSFNVRCVTKSLLSGMYIVPSAGPA